MSRVNLYDNGTLSWRHGGRLYLIHIQRDELAENPRENDNLAVMACWHRRYSLGDKLEDKDISFGDDISSAVKAYEDLRLLIDKFITAKQGKFSGIKSASNFLNQCGTALEYLHRLYKGKETFEAERFKEFYADVYCDFDYMLSWEIGSDNSDDVCPFKPHSQSSWFVFL